MEEYKDILLRVGEDVFLVLGVVSALRGLSYYWGLFNHYKGKLIYYQQIFYYYRKLLKYRSSGPAQEMTFWRDAMSRKRITPKGDYIFHRESDIEAVLDLMRSSFGVSGKSLRVLDIGPGPKTGLATGYNRGEYDLVGVDPLAEDYKREFGGGDFLVSGRGEDIGKMFSPNSFHIVYASNSIDHCEDPHQVIEGVLSVLKSGGIFIVSGNEREGARSCWQGYHKHNLWVEDGRIMHSGRSGVVSVLVGSSFELVKKRDLIYDWEGAKIKWFYGEWRKH